MVFGGYRVRLAALALAVFLTGAWQAVPESGPAAKLAAPNAAEINGVLKELSAVTGFRIRHELPFALISREQVNAYIKDQIKRSVKPDDIRAQETTLKKLGFVPPDFDLKQTTIDLLTEQAAAFYDFRRKKLFISNWAAVNMRDTAVIHELAHALADQTFSIQKFLGKADDNSEASMAREAVVEGQASWLMLEVDARRNGRTMADPDVAHALLDTDSDTTDNQYPVFNRAPLYLRKTMLFPYDAGEKFQEAVFQRDGKAGFAKVFQDPPSSTAQIDDPARYFNHEVFTSPKLPPPAKHARPYVTGSLGELETRILLQQYVDAGTARALAPDLKGSSYRLDKTKGQKDKEPRVTLTYASEWRDDVAATLYFDAYRKVLTGKWKNVDVKNQSPDLFEGKSEDGYFKVIRDGVRVLSQEDFENPPA
ncbi:MAG TPA: hypothetical protein VG273_23645 [Bryobacteraceae bacterium]|jgi:hypothetical protein|nr:hypothetical protein [Bryobacteraceae bacterium]